jgi:hypothetical protein
MPRRHNRTGRSRHGPPFVQLFKYMLGTPAWLSLSAIARAAYVQLALRYNGSNNGQLGLSVRTLADELGCSRSTAARALIELEDAGFIDAVKIGRFSLKNRRASEYRLTIFRCDLSGQLPSKRFLEAGSPQALPRDRTAPPQSQGTRKRGPQFHHGARQRQVQCVHSTTDETHLESYHGGCGKGEGATIVHLPTKTRARAKRALHSAVASEREQSSATNSKDDDAAGWVFTELLAASRKGPI